MCVSFLLFAVQIFFKSLAAELARRAVSATIAWHSIIACERALAHQVEHAQLIGHCPGGAFVNPHQRRVDYKLLLKAQVEGDVEGTDEAVATVGIAGKVGLRNTGHEMPYATLTCIDGGYADKEEIAPRHECVGRAVGGLHLVHDNALVGQRTFGERADKAHVHLVEVHTSLTGYLPGKIYLVHMFLSIYETKRTYFLEMFLRPKKTGRRVLPAAQNDKGTRIVEKSFHYALIMGCFKGLSLKVEHLQRVIGYIFVNGILPFVLLKETHDAHRYG